LDQKESPMHNVTPLSSGSLNDQTLKVELVEPGNDLPNAVAIRWPVKPTVTSPATFDKVVGRRDERSCQMRSSSWPRSGCGKSCEWRRSQYPRGTRKWPA
jgi:hypothetical protein